MTTTLASRESGHFHAVRFYADDKSLERSVDGFVAEGHIADQPAIWIATPAHFSDIANQLRSMSFDVETLLNDRRLIALDAQETLNRVVRDGIPDAQLFEDAIVPVFD